MAELVEPRLPQELERIIFELAARTDNNKSLPALLRVARRVRDWLQGIIYETIVLKDSDFYKRSKSSLHHPSRFPSGTQLLYLRKLLVSHMDNAAESEPNWWELLSQCHNIQDLAIWSMSPPPADDTLSTLSSLLISPLRSVTPHGLRRLSMSLVHLFYSCQTSFNHEVFKDITHLEVLDFPKGCEWKEGNNLACLQNLQYFSIGTVDYIGLHAGPLSPTGFLRKCLKECKALDLLILSEAAKWEGVEELLKDFRWVVASDGTVEETPGDRLVIYYLPGISGAWSRVWYRDTIGEDGMWGQSKKIVERRRWKRGLKKILWDSLVDSDADVDLGEWMSAMEVR
ncbi:hypothetical protein AX16_006023 [Volvariella volvacea WC 439]|nr:hypothetical protein AX16_006023 [Volvariella volvacea WC 439]